MGKRSHEDSTVSEAGSESASTSMASPAKIQEVEANETASQPGRMQCSLPPHQPLSFASSNDFDIHYVQEHINRCSSCGKNFPSAHYLALHIDENHNSMREALADQGEKTYACFVQDCDRKCSTPQKRRLHLIDKHLFPKAYNFRIVDHGIDKTSSLLLGGQRRRLSINAPTGQRRRASLVPVFPLPPDSSAGSNGTTASTSDAGSTTASEHPILTATEKVAELERSFAALQFIPSSVQARQRNQRLGR